MILVDSSIWVDHIRQADATLSRLLDLNLVLVHPGVIGEIALGHMRDRDAMTTYLHTFPAPVLAKDGEVLGLIARERLFGIGIGWVDAHLLTATMLTDGAQLWTRDRRLSTAADRLGLAAAL